MDTRIAQAVRIRIDAPDPGSALRLERRLAHLAPTALSVSGTWWVEIPDLDRSHVGELEATVEAWLAEEQLAETAVHEDGVTHTVTAEAQR